eukprot:scaffold185004_cov28-Prasinocladus_malaysianus.AAC.1
MPAIQNFQWHAKKSTDVTTWLQPIHMKHEDNERYQVREFSMVLRLFAHEDLTNYSIGDAITVLDAKPGGCCTSIYSYWFRRGHIASQGTAIV